MRLRASKLCADSLVHIPEDFDAWIVPLYESQAIHFSIQIEKDQHKSETRKVSRVDVGVQVFVQFRYEV